MGVGMAEARCSHLMPWEGRHAKAVEALEAAHGEAVAAELEEQRAAMEGSGQAENRRVAW